MNKGFPNHIATHEVAKFDQLADQWWNQESGPHKLLHALNPLRIEYIQNMLMKVGKSDAAQKILDVGCGGGLVCEPLSRLGHEVTGIDASAKAIQVAQQHAEEHDLKIRYICGDVADISDQFDVVCAFEVVEHVDNLSQFLNLLKSKLKTNGIIILSTIHQTMLSYLGAIVWAEYVQKIVPKGTHDWKKFVKPSEIIAALGINNCSIIDLQGYTYLPWRQEWRLITSIQLNYFMTLSNLSNSLAPSRAYKSSHPPT